MRQMKSFLILVIVLFGVVSGLSAQTTAPVTVEIKAVALLAVKTAGTTITFVIDDPAGPNAAGKLPSITSANGPTYLRYTVIVAPATTMKIQAQSDTIMPKGLKLDIWAAVPTGTGGLGTPVAGGLTITSGSTADTPSDLITGITSCATGNGDTQGPAIYYTLSIDAATFNEMSTQGSATYTILYTLL